MKNVVLGEESHNNDETSPEREEEQLKMSKKRSIKKGSAKEDFRHE